MEKGADLGERGGSMKISLYDYCIENSMAELLESWDAEKNGGLTPREVSYGSSARKVWWRCERGHSWQASPYSRTSGSGCPYCTGKLVGAGVNDLATLYPALAGEWDYEKNAPLTPGEVSVGSHRKVWWRCGNGHEWQALIKSRVSGAGCPVCANRVAAPGENDLASEYPELAGEWDRVKNAPLLPENFTPGSRRKVWWRCGKGHSWQASVASRVKGSGCPICTGRAIIPGVNDLGTLYPAIAREWHPTKNGSLRPDSCAPASSRKVWWVCPMGHEYQTTVGVRTVNGSGCPYCAGRKVLKGFNDLAAVEPKIAAQWHPTLNGALTPEQVTAGSRRKVWWICPLGHVWKAVIYSRTGKRKCGCPVCAGTVQEPRRVRLDYIGKTVQNETTFAAK